MGFHLGRANSFAGSKSIIISIMNSKKIVIILSIVGVLLVLLLLSWDCLVPSPYQALTIKPSETDWKVFSFSNVDVNALIQTLLSALISFVLTIVFVEMLLKSSRDRELKYKKEVQFKNISKIIRVPLFRYHKAAISMTYGIGNIPQNNIVRVPVTSSALANVFSPQAYADESLFQTNIEFYANAVDNLQSCITNILLNVDLSDNDELSELLSDYIMMVSATNPCRQILDMRNQLSGKERMTEFIKRELPNVDLNTVKGSNIFLPFARLKVLLEYHEMFINRLYALAPSFNLENGNA